MEKIEVILTNCIKEIKSGKASLNDCLDRYPSLRRELEPLLEVALNVQQPQGLNMDSDYKQVAKARLLQQIRATRQKKAWSFGDILSLGVPPRFAWARVAVSVVTIVIVLSLMAGGTAYASQSSLPGDLLYPVKIGTEDARLLIAGDSADKVNLNLQFAQTRLEEMDKLASSDEEKTGIAVNRYRDNLDAAREQLRNISDASVLSYLLDRALTDVQNQMTFCDNVIDSNPAYPEQVEEASSLNIDAQVELLKMLETQNPLRAAELNLNAMQNRLQRANIKANASQFQEMQEALLQYQQFNGLGEDILEYARETGVHDVEIEELSISALSDYLDTLDNIARGAPQEYRSTVEASRQETLEHEAQVWSRNQHQGESRPETPGNKDESDAGQGQDTSPQNQERNQNAGDEIPNNTPTPAPDGDSGGRGGSENNSNGGNGGGNANAPGDTPGGNLLKPGGDTRPNSGL